jgi:hypothetical protein
MVETFEQINNPIVTVEPPAGRIVPLSPAQRWTQVGPPLDQTVSAPPGLAPAPATIPPAR